MKRLFSLLLAPLLLFGSAAHAQKTATYVNSWFTNAQGAQVQCVGLQTPVETAPGDLMLALFTLDDGTPNKTGYTSIAAPPGWTLVSDAAGNIVDQNSTDSTGFGVHQAMYYRIATSSEPAAVTDPACKSLPGNYIWHFSNSNNANTNGIRVTAGVVIYRGVDAANPIDVVSTAAALSTNAITALSVTTTTANDTLLGLFGLTSNVGNQGLTAPAGMTIPQGINDGANGAVTPYNQQSGAGPNGVSQLLAEEVFAGPGATGNRIATGTFSNQPAVGQLIAIRGSPLDHFVIEAVGGGDIGQQTAGQSFNIRIRAVDAAGNTIGFIGSVDLTSNCAMSAGSGTTPTFTNGLLDNYAVTISGTGTCRFTATETGGTTTGSSNDFTVASGAAVMLQVLIQGETAAPGTASGKTGAPISPVQGNPFTVIVNAVDANWNVVDVNDSISISSSDGSAALPGNVDLVNGTVTFTVTSYTAGTWTIGAHDLDSGTIADGTSSPYTVLPLQGGFNAFDSDTPAGAIFGPIRTRIAGQGFSVDFIAIKNNGEDEQFKKTVTVSLWASNDATLAPGGCPGIDFPQGNWIVIQTQTFTFPGTTPNRIPAPAPWVAGNAFRQARFQIDGNNTTSCSTDSFAIRPASLGNVIAQDASSTTAGTARTLNVSSAAGVPFHNAGQPFTISVTGLTAGGAVTTHYDGIPEIDSLSLLLPTTCATCAPGALTLGTWAANGAGQVTTNTASYAEAGAFDLVLVDKHFADVDMPDTADSSRFVYSQPAPIGRFVPDHFAVARNSPSFATACPAGQFTYIGEPFFFAAPPILTVTAQNAQNDITVNYTGDAFRLTHTSVTGRNYLDATGAANALPLDQSGLPLTSSDPAIVDNGDGTATLTFSTGSGLYYAHVLAGGSSTPEPPFDAVIDLSVSVKDDDGVAVTTVDGGAAANPVTFSAIPFNNGAEMRWGRLFLRSAVGSEFLDLPVPMVAQYWASDDRGFVTNTADNCTSGVQVTLSNFQPYAGNSSPGSGWLTGAASWSQLAGSSTPGDFGLSLAEPGNNHAGAVDVSVDLAAPAPSWLLYDWDGDGSFDDNPSTRAAFGVYSGDPSDVYQHEVVGP